MAFSRVSQQGIVLGIFAVMFVGFVVFLPGFFTTANMLTLLQNVAVLGILGLAMAIVVIGRGIDISMIAVLAVPPAWCCRWCRTALAADRAVGRAAAVARLRRWSTAG